MDEQFAAYYRVGFDGAQSAEWASGWVQTPGLRRFDHFSRSLRNGLAEIDRPTVSGWYSLPSRWLDQKGR